MQVVADKVKVHSATVSRTVRDKYMTTPFGTVELRRFFTSGVATESGEQMSNTAVQQMLKALVDAEDRSHPLSDERLAAILKAKGVDIARRTVAKYRKALKIPSTSERRI
jgi:RNA polymerase sigma-54 factor